MHWPTAWTGHDGAASINTAPRPATTPVTEFGSHDQRSTTAVLGQDHSCRTVTSLKDAGQAQPDQRAHRPVDTQQRVGQLEEFIGSRTKPPVHPATEAPRPVGRLRAPPRVNPAGQAHPAHPATVVASKLATPTHHAVTALMPEPEPQ